MANNNRELALPHGNQNMENIQNAVQELHQLRRQQEMDFYPPIQDQAASSFYYYLPQQVPAPARYFGVHQAPPPLSCVPPPPLSCVPPPPPPLPNQVNGDDPVNNQVGGSANQANGGANQVGDDDDSDNNQAGNGANQANVGANQAGGGANQADVGANQVGGGDDPANNQAGGGANQADVGANQVGGGDDPANNQAGGGANQANVGAYQAGRGVNQAGAGGLLPRGNRQRHAPRGFFQGRILRGYAHYGHAPYGYAPYGYAPQYGVQYQLPHDQAFLNFYRQSQPPIQDRQLLAGYNGRHQGPPPRVQLIMPNRVELPQEQDLYRQVPGHQAGGGGPADHQANDGGGPVNNQVGDGANYARDDSLANSRAAGSVADDGQAANNARERAIDLPSDEYPLSEPSLPTSSVKRGRCKSSGRSRANRARSRGRGRGGNVIIYM